MFLLVKWMMAAAAATVACSVSSGDTIARLHLRDLLYFLYESRHQSKAMRSIFTSQMCTWTLSEGKLTVVSSICFSHIIQTAAIYASDRSPPSHCFYLPLTNTHTRAHTSRGDVRVSIHSAEASCTPGDSPGWWCWLRSGCAGRGGPGRGGMGEWAHRPVLQGLLNLHIPVHLAPGQAQECPLM